MLPFKLTALALAASASIVIKSPQTLKNLFPEGKIEVSYANFGLIPYGHMMVSETGLMDLY